MCIKKLLAYIGGDAWQMDPLDAETKLRNRAALSLQNNEEVLLAFKNKGGFGWGEVYFTTKRVLQRNVKGSLGKQHNYVSIPYEIIQAYSVDTPALIDNDVELIIHSEGLDQTSISFACAGSDIFAIQRLLSVHVLPGGSIMATEEQAAATESYDDGEDKKTGKVGDFFSMLGGDAKQIDPAEIELTMKTEPQNILLPGEKVELAFSCGRDTTLLTSHRMVLIDVQGLTGKKVQYKSVLWKCARAFEIETAGGIFDADCSMGIWTNIKSMRLIEQDLAKGKVDLMAIQRFFSDKILGQDTAPQSEEDLEALKGQRDSGGGLMAFMGDDYRQIDPAAANEQFHSDPAILQGSETIEMAFKGRRDMTLFSNKRMIIVDVSGIVSKKTKYISIPWTTMTAYAVRSAGSFLDKDSEMMIWTDIFYKPEVWNDDKTDIIDPREAQMSYLEQDFQKDKVDLMAIQRYLSERILGSRPGGTLGPDTPVNMNVMAAGDPDAMEKFLGWLTGDAEAINPQAMEEQLRTGGVIMGDESVLMALRCGRDTTCFTSKRILLIDKQGTISTKTEYKSVPWSSVRAFEVESAGAFDTDSEAKIWVNNWWDMAEIKQDMKKGGADIIELNRIMAAGVFGNEDGSSAMDSIQPAPAPEEGGFKGFMSVLTGDAAQINSESVDKQLRSCPAILQDDETVEMAFKCGRDMTVYTSKRLLKVDVQGLFGKKISYTSIPLKYMQAFEVQTAGGCCDFNCETFLWTDVPGQSCVTSSMSKKSGMIFELNAMLGLKLLREDGPAEQAYAVVRAERDATAAAAEAERIAAAERAEAAKQAERDAKAAAKA